MNWETFQDYLRAVGRKIYRKDNHKITATVIGVRGEEEKIEFKVRYQRDGSKRWVQAQTILKNWKFQ